MISKDFIAPEPMDTEPAAEGYPRTYYASSAPLLQRNPALAGSTRADVCVVGGGIAGCSAALYLAERGYDVVLLDGERVGWGASGRNGGQVIAGIAAEQADLERLLGAADARRIWDVSLAGISRLRQQIERHRIECHWTPGQMFTAIKPRQWRWLQTQHEQLTDRYGCSSTRLLTSAQLCPLLGTRRYIGALYDANGGHLHPLRYTLGLAAAAARAGVRIHEATRALGFESNAGGVRVRVAAGRVQCDRLILAGNAWLGTTAPALQRKLIGVGSYIIATEPLGEERAAQLIANNAAVCDTNWILDYFRRSADHRLLFGGRVSYSGIERSIVSATRARMLRVFPQLREVRVQYAWGCQLDLTLNRAPHFGRLGPNVYFLQGFSGHGLALAGLAGELAACAVAGDSERFDVFARIPHHDFPGGMLLRRPLLVLAMLWYRLRDLL